MKVDVFISGRKLKDLDTFSRADPVCIAYEFRDGAWVEVDRTERIENDLNPDFRKHLTLDYHFERAQKIRFVIVDDDGENDFDTIGQVDLTMG